jgi:hypothetical protein
MKGWPASAMIQSIGIDDGNRRRKPGRVSDERERAERFAAQFRAVYLTFHRRDAPRSQLAGASRAVLEHLAMAGPLTIGEAAAHLSRAQARRNPRATREELERQTLDYMATMPAWRDHPRITARQP